MKPDRTNLYPVPPFTRKDLQRGEASLLSRGHWGNADLLLYRQGKNAWVVKDFTTCPWWVRQLWGRLLINRELHVLRRLRGISGVPRSSFRVDSFSFAYPYTPGRAINALAPQEVGSKYFLALEQLVREIHRRKVAHLDIRHLSNILVTEQGYPALVDFQSSLFLDRIPGSVCRILKDIDISGVYKCWRKINPETMNGTRRSFLAAMEKRRRFWILKGYPLGLKRLHQRKYDNV